MTRRIILLALIISICPFARAAWVDADGAGQYEPEVIANAGNSYMPDIAIDQNGYPNVTWYDSENGNLEIYYLRWNGTEWVDADGIGQESSNISQTLTNSEYPRIALDPAGRPCITWEDGTSGDREVYFLRWDGTDWVDADGTGRGQIAVSNMAGYSGHPAIAVDASGNPRIAWMQQDGADENDCDIYYARWNGTSWVGATPGPPAKIYDTPYYSAWPHMKLDGSGRPCVVWADGPDLDREIYYLHWDGFGWVDADGAGTESVIMSNTPKYSGWADLALDSNDRPHVAWEDTSTGDQNIYYLKWNGLDWVDADGSGRDGINISGTYHFSTVPTIRIDKATDTPYVVYSEGSIETCDVYCKMYNGAAWTDASGSGLSYVDVRPDPVNSEWPSFDLDPAGRPHVVWSDGVVMQAHDIYYQKWEPAGTPTASPTVDLSGTPYPTQTPTRTFTPTFTVSMTPTRTQVPVPYFDPGPCWADVDGSGNEYNPVFSGRDPQLRLSPAGLPLLAWEQYNSIYFSKYNGAWWTTASGAGKGPEMISGTVFQCASPRLCVDSGGRPCVAWTGFFTESTMIYYLRWDGSAWVDVDGGDQLEVSVPIINGGYARDVSLDLDNADRPGVAWVDYPENLTYTVKDVFFYRWDGSDWVDADGAGRGQGMVTDNTLPCGKPSLAFDSASMPGLAFIRGGVLCYLKWNGAAWVDADGSGDESMQVALAQPRDEDLEPQLEFDSLDRPHIAWIMKSPYGTAPAYIRYDGASWVDVTGSGTAQAAVAPENSAVSVSLALDWNGEPGVAWSSATGGVRYLKRCGNSWADVDGTGAQTQDVAPPFSGPPTGISLQFYFPGRPAVAWSDNMSGTDSVFYLADLCMPPTPTFTPSISPTSTMTQTITPTATQSVTFTESGTPTITCTWTGTPPPTVTATVTPVPALVAMEKSVAAGAEQDTVIYTITIKNDPVWPVYNITAWDTLPSEVSFGAMISGPEPEVSGNYVFWDFGGGVTPAGDVITLKFTARITDPAPGQVFVNRAASDYNDSYYLSARHPAVYSNQALYPEDAIVVYPNPFDPAMAQGGKLKFVNVRENHEIYLFTVSGELVLIINPMAGQPVTTWDGKNRYAIPVSKGIYYYFIRDRESGSLVTKGKIFLTKNQ